MGWMEDGCAPVLDGRSAEAIMEELGGLAKAYVPEWRMDAEKPDGAFALARLFAEMMEGTLLLYNRSLERERAGFLSCLGDGVRPALHATGYLVMGLSSPDAPGCLVPAGTRVAASTSGGKRQYVTREPVFVSDVAADPVQVREDGWYLRLTGRMGPFPIHLLFLFPGCGRGCPVLWEYWDGSGWDSLQAADGTARLSRSGVVCFAAPGDFEESGAGGEKGYWLRIRPIPGPEAAPMPPVPPGVWSNGVGIRALESGEGSNLDAGQTFQMMEAAGFVTKAWSPAAVYGGWEEETEGEAMERRRAAVCHRQGGVTAKDLERLAAEASREVERVCCFSGWSEKGEQKSGAVTLVVLLRDFLDGRRYFYRVQEEILGFLEGRADARLVGGGSLCVAEPVYVRLDVKARVRVRGPELALESARMAEKRLEEFFNPLSGGYEGSGWPMGVLPGHEMVLHVLEQVPGVTFVAQLYLTAWVERDGAWREAELEQCRRLPWCLPLSGEQKVWI